MKSSEIVSILKDLFDEYGVHANLTSSEKRQVEMWLEGMAIMSRQVEEKGEAHE